FNHAFRFPHFLEPLVREACRILYSLSVLPVDNATVKDLAILSETGLVRLMSHVLPYRVAAIIAPRHFENSNMASITLLTVGQSGRSCFRAASSIFDQLRTRARNS